MRVPVAQFRIYARFLNKHRDIAGTIEMLRGVTFRFVSYVRSKDENARRQFRAAPPKMPELRLRFPRTPEGEVCPG